MICALRLGRVATFFGLMMSRIKLGVVLLMIDESEESEVEPWVLT